MKASRTIEKTDGEGNTMIVENPDYYLEDNKFHKLRRKPTNITEKKKKRKKYKKH